VLTNQITIFGVTIWQGGIMGVALGVVLGSIAQLIISSIGMIGMDFEYQFKIFWKNLGLQRVLRLLPPRSIDQGIDYFNNLVEINLASRLGAGAITAFQVATTLHMVPITLIGVAISTAIFPKLSDQLAQGKAEQFKREVRTFLRVAVITFLGRGYIVAFIKVGGAPEIADILGTLALAILFRSIYHLASRSFYAQQDTRTPLYVSIGTILLNIALATTFVMVFNMGVFGLAAAQAIVAFIEVMILFMIMSSRLKGLFSTAFIHGVLRMISATGLMFIVAYVMIKSFNLTHIGSGLFSLLPSFTLIVVVSLGSYVLFSYLFRIEEATPLLRKLRAIIFSKVRPVS
jgi:putative peptidoglycan lipid II flippase